MPLLLHKIITYFKQRGWILTFQNDFPFSLDKYIYCRRSVIAAGQNVRPSRMPKVWMFEFRPRQTLVVKTGRDSSTATGIKCHESSKMTIINGCPVSRQVWHAKEPLLQNDQGAKWHNLQSFTARFVRSQFEYKITSGMR